MTPTGRFIITWMWKAVISFSRLRFGVSKVHKIAGTISLSNGASQLLLFFPSAFWTHLASVTLSPQMPSIRLSMLRSSQGVTFHGLGWFLSALQENNLGGCLFANSIAQHFTQFRL